jgi:hypothetical protein
MKWGGSKPQDYMRRKGMFPSAFLFSFLLFPYPLLSLPFLTRCSTQVLQEVCSHVNYTQGIVTVKSQLLLRVFSILTQKDERQIYLIRKFKSFVRRRGACLPSGTKTLLEYKGN